MAKIDTKMTVDRSAFTQNFQHLQSLIDPKTPIIAVAKADGYGYGLCEMATLAVRAGAWAIGVGSADEALELRKNGITETTIILLYPCLTEQLPALLEQDISITVDSPELVAAAAQAAVRLKTTANVHVQIETGMNFIGLAIDDITKIATILLEYSQSVSLAGISTHFAAVAQDSVLNTQQATVFRQALQEFARCGVRPGLIHVANSAVVDLLPELVGERYYSDVMPDIPVGVRCGSILYGTYASRSGRVGPLHPVLKSITTTILAIKTVKKGETVGYFNAFRAVNDCQVAIISIGWGVGFFPCDGRGAVLIKGKLAQVVGPIGANICAVDVTHTSVSVGDEVVIIGVQNGSEITLEDAAMQHATFTSRQVALFSSMRKRYVN